MGQKSVIKKKSKKSSPAASGDKSSKTSPEDENSQPVSTKSKKKRAKKKSSDTHNCSNDPVSKEVSEEAQSISRNKESKTGLIDNSVTSKKQDDSLPSVTDTNSSLESSKKEVRRLERKQKYEEK